MNLGDLLRSLMNKPRQDLELRKQYLKTLSMIAEVCLTNDDPEISTVLFALLGLSDDKARLHDLAALAAEASKRRLIAAELKRDPRCEVVHQN